MLLPLCLRMRAVAVAVPRPLIALFFARRHVERVPTVAASPLLWVDVWLADDQLHISRGAAKPVWRSLNELQRVEGWKGGRVEGWKGGRVEGWKGAVRVST